ncbi:MAG: T9SS type A sorting domain-containing protein [Bacteroidales bacterium]|nr:T9SS type A sorting domain-containing protein [Bacteroidales bacterium]
MKKRLYVLALMLVLGFSAGAQDTLSAISLKSSYFHNVWPNFVNIDDSVGYRCYFMNMHQLAPVYAKLHGGRFDAGNDTITVYGLAVGLESIYLSITQRPIWDSSGHLIGYVDDSSRYYADLNKIYDTSAYEEAYELWGLYIRGSNEPQRISAQLPVNVKLDRPTYYLDFGTYEDGSYTEMTPMLPVREVFFHTPVSLKGEFYVGITNRQHEMGLEYNKTYYTWPTALRLILPACGDPSDMRQGDFSYQPNYNPPRWVYSQTGPLAFAFPIITPPDSSYVWDTTVVAADTVVAIGNTLFASDDTIIISGDTTIVVDGDTIVVAGGTVITYDTVIVYDSTIVLDTAIVGGDTIIYYDTIVRTDTIVHSDTLLSIPDRSLLGRMTGIMPNPATETVKVLSNFGLEAIDVFTIKGEHILTLRLPEVSLTATIDVREWPSGTYLLRIHTPMGTSVKKLIVK